MAAILLVDDDRDQLEVRQAIFERAGFQVWAATAAPDALALIESERPSSVILDLCLPGEDDGVRLLRDIRARFDWLRVFVLSGWVERFAASEDAALADGILRKPFRSADLIELLRNGD